MSAAPKKFDEGRLMQVLVAPIISEKATIASFLGSPAGTKLIGNAVLTDSPQGRKATRERILELHARCST